MSEAAMMLDMDEKKKVGRPKNKAPRPPRYTIHVQIEMSHGEALDRWIGLLSPKPTNKAAIELLLEEFLGSKGILPPEKFIHKRRQRGT